MSIYKDLARLFMTVDGSSSSGNFGHSGRKGKVGGSQETESTNNPEDSRLFGHERINSDKEKAAYKKIGPKSKKHYDFMLSHEKRITSNIENALSSNKMKMIGEKYAIKQPSSFDRKIKDVMFEKNVTEDEALGNINDALRYTGVSSPKDLVKNTDKVLRKLLNDGHKIIELKNTWNNDESPYKGINIKMIDDSGVKYELQFHTAQSFDMKERKQHKFYEEWRDRNTSDERKEKLSQIMFNFISINPRWSIPEGVDKLSQESYK